MRTYICVVFWNIIIINGYEDLSANKSAIQSSTALCFPPCIATFAVDGNLQTCMKTSEIGTSATSKSIWWYVDLRDINSIYSVRIKFSDYGTDDKTVVMRQRGRFAGFSLYVSNSTNKENGYRCYQDGPDLPSLDFNTTCVTQGRFVIFYNERLDGITYPAGYQTSNLYTDLCEVTVTGCKNPSVYGYDCNLPCPENCQESRCFIVSGTCLGCTAGWIGEFCNNSCPAGYYGLECRSPCTGHCRYNKACNQSTGVCDEGCADGWTGNDCSKQCPADTYGPDCKYNCSGHCLNGFPCNKTTGNCNSGCKPGYTGERCDKACSIGSYGLKCAEQCNNHYRHGINYCNREDGHCETGCEDGFIGRKCNKTCDEGWYGENCSLPCSRNCVKQSCHRIQGNCLYRCEPGWMGLKCNQECSEGTYGKDCLRPCSSHCINNTTCNSVNGSCTEGCAPGYYGNLCVKRNSGETDNAICKIPEAYIAGLSLSVFINFLFAVTFIIFFRRFSKKDKEKMSSQYITSSRAIPQLQDNNNDSHNYQELNVTIDNSYQNMTLRDCG